jgi:hypothetical protein
VPPAFLAGFGEHVAAASVRDALADSGFTEVCSVDGCEDALRAEVAADAAAAHERPRPVLSPACPSVVDLIELRFPSLIAHLAPFASPWESLAAASAGSDTPSTSCRVRASAARWRPAASTPLAAPSSPPCCATSCWRASPVASSEAAGAASHRRRRRRPLRVTGIDHVIAVLEQIEDGLLTTPAAIELYVCDGGCFGSPLLGRRPVPGRGAGGRPGDAGDDHSHDRRARAEPFAARPGIRLDADMAKAIQKLAPPRRRAARRCPARTAASAARRPARRSPKTWSSAAPTRPVPVPFHRRRLTES